MRQLLRRPIVRGGVTLLAGEGATRVLSFLAVALLARRLGDVGWAPVAVALTISQFGTLFIESGMRLYGAREVARSPDAAQRIMPVILTSQLAIALCFVLLAVSASAFHAVRPELASLLPGYAVALLALPFFLPWVFQGLGLMQWVAAPQVLRFGLFLLLCALLVTGGSRVTWLPWLELVSMAAGAAMALAVARGLGISPSVRPSGAFQRDAWRESVPIAASQLLWVVRMYLPIVFLWKLGTAESVARFDLSHRVLMVMSGFLTMYLTNLYTHLSRVALREPRTFARLLSGSTALAGAGSSAVAVLLAASAGPLLGVLYSQVFNHPEASVTLMFLAFAFPVLAVRGHGYYALITLGRQRLELLCSLVNSLVLVVLLLRWVPTASAVGAARALLVAELTGMLLTWLAVSAVMRTPAIRS